MRNMMTMIRPSLSFSPSLRVTYNDNKHDENIDLFNNDNDIITVIVINFIGYKNKKDDDDDDDSDNTIIVIFLIF